MRGLTYTIDHHCEVVFVMYRRARTLLWFSVAASGPFFRHCRRRGRPCGVVEARGRVLVEAPHFACGRGREEPWCEGSCDYLSHGVISLFSHESEAAFLSKMQSAKLLALEIVAALPKSDCARASLAGQRYA